LLREKAIETEKLNKFNTILGFRRVFHLLTEYKKPLVVHNGMYDLMFMLHHIDTPLPEKLSEFGAIIHDYFPEIYDTKYLATYGDLCKDMSVSTSLEEVYKKSIDSGEVTKISLAEGFTKYKNGQHLHEAGYDAYLTGSIFSIWREKILEKNTSATDHKQKLINKHVLNKCINVWSFDGPSYLIGTVFHCTVPNDYNVSDFERVLEGHPPFSVLWVDEKSALVVFMGQVDSESVIGCLDKQGLLPKKMIAEDIK